jgi:hypothetical protein
MPLEINQSIHTTVFQTTKRGCKIEVSGSNAMFSLRIGKFKQDNGHTTKETEHYLYRDELDALIENLIAFKEKQLNSIVVNK